MKITKKDADEFLEKVRKTHVRLHKAYEQLFWKSYMGDHSVDEKKQRALVKLNAFRGSIIFKTQARHLLKSVSNIQQKTWLQYWIHFFEAYQTPEKMQDLRNEIDALEDSMTARRTSRKEGYVDPDTALYVKASYLKMRSMIRTHSDEKVRKACFDATELLAEDEIETYIKYVGLLNTYACALGYEDFYAYKLMQEEGMTKQEVFALFDTLYEKTKYAFDEVHILAKQYRGLRKPWNYSYFLSGDFTKEEDPYFPFEEALDRWGRSFTALGVGFRGGTLQLDLLDRQGKYANGFCHWPTLVHTQDGIRIPGAANFTCNVVYGEPGASAQGYHTLFHEGGHAAHLLNTTQKDTCLNHEYPPMSTAWAETQSMFMDTLFASYAWKSRYAKNKEGDIYPFDLFQKKVEKLHVLTPLSFNGINMVAQFEKAIYEEQNLTVAKVKHLARNMVRKYSGYTEDSLMLLNVPHLYSWTSACSYHAYGLAELALFQWRDYFTRIYGYIVDNPHVGKEMRQVWKLGAQKTFKAFVIQATGKRLSAHSWIRAHTKSTAHILKEAQHEAQILHKRPHTRTARLVAHIRMVHGKKTISTNAKSFSDMAQKYAQWLQKQNKK